MIFETISVGCDDELLSRLLANLALMIGQTTFVFELKFNDLKIVDTPPNNLDAKHVDEKKVKTPEGKYRCLVCGGNKFITDHPANRYQHKKTLAHKKKLQGNI
jgi:hypothetical protein